MTYRISRLAALLSLAVLSLLAFPVFAQTATAPSDPGADVFAQLIAAVTNLRTGATLAGLVIGVHLLVTLSKLPTVADHINAAWRPVIAVALGVLGGILASLASGSPFAQALSLGIPAGIAAAGGSVVLHEAAQSVQMAWAWLTKDKIRDIGKPLAVLVIGGMLLPQTSCVTAWSAAVKASPACYQLSASNLETVAEEVYTAVTDLAASNAIGAAEQIIANEHIDYETALCIYQIVENQIANPNGGELAYVPPDAGVATSPETALARAVAMSPQQTLALERIHTLQFRAQSGLGR